MVDRFWKKKTNIGEVVKTMKETGSGKSCETMEATDSGKSLKPWRQQIVESRWNHGGNIYFGKEKNSIKKRRHVFLFYMLFTSSTVHTAKNCPWPGCSDTGALICPPCHVSWELNTGIATLLAIGWLGDFKQGPTNDRVCPAQWQFLPGRLVHQNLKTVLCLSYEVLPATWCVGKNRKN